MRARVERAIGRFLLQHRCAWCAGGLSAYCVCTICGLTVHPACLYEHLKHCQRKGHGHDATGVYTQ